MKNGIAQEFDARGLIKFADLLRSRNRLDEEIVLSSIKNYIGLKNKDLNRLSQYARLFHVEKKIKTYLEILL